MPTIPGVPTLDPVSKPSMSPGEAGRPGEAIYQGGEVALDNSLQQQSLSLYMKKAQEHVDSLSARNEMDKAYADFQNQLAKTPNSRDIPDVVQQGNKTLNDISARWSKSPAAIAIQMDTDALRPGMGHVGTVRQIDLMGKEFEINISHQAETLSGDYASGNRDQAVAAFSAAVDGGAKTGLVGEAEAGEYVRMFKEKGQELEIKNGITNSNPEVNQRIYDQISQHRDQYPDVTQEKLDTYKGQALSAYEAHTKFQDWAEGDMARKTQLVPKIDQFTNPATRHFDEAGALTDNAERFARGEITETQSNVLASGFSSHQAQLHVGLKQESSKRLDDIEKKLSGPNYDFSGAAEDLEQNKPWFENNGFSEDYRAALRYASQKHTEVRAVAAASRSESRYENQYARQEARENSQETFAEGLRIINDGKLLTYSDIYGAAGEGKGKLSTTDANNLWGVMQKIEKDNPDFAAGIKYVNDAFPIPKNATKDISGAQNKRYAETFNLFQQQVNANPDKSKLEIAAGIVKGVQQQQIKDNADAMFGTTPATSALPTAFGAFKNFISTPFTYGLKPGDAGYKEPTQAGQPKPGTANEGDTKKNSEGVDVVFRNGKWEYK